MIHEVRATSMESHMTRSALTLVLLLSCAVLDASAGRFPSVKMSIDCGTFRVIFPGADGSGGDGVRRVYSGDVARCRALTSFSADIREPPPCVGSLDEYADALQVRLLRGSGEPVARPEDAEGDYFAAWWSAVNDRTVDVSITITPREPIAPGSYPERTVEFRGLADLAAGEYRAVFFHGADFLSRCVPDMRPDFIRECAGRGVLVLGPPREGADRLQWLFDQAVSDINEGVPEDAILHARELVALRPRSAYGYGILGRAQKATGDCRSAASSFRQALRLAELPADERDPFLNYGPETANQAHTGRWRRLLSDCVEDE